MYGWTYSDPFSQIRTKAREMCLHESHGQRVFLPFRPMLPEARPVRRAKMDDLAMSS